MKLYQQLMEMKFYRQSCFVCSNLLFWGTVALVCFILVKLGIL